MILIIINKYEINRLGLSLATLGIFRMSTSPNDDGARGPFKLNYIRPGLGGGARGFHMLPPLPI